MPTESSSASQGRRSTRFSQRLRNLRHLRLGAGEHNEQKQPEPEFQITHTPDRPTHPISPLEAPTEEECFADIRGWHSAAESSRQAARIAQQQAPRQQMTNTTTASEAVRDNSVQILKPRAYACRVDCYISDTEDEDLSDGDRSLESDPRPAQEAHDRFAKLLNYNPTSASQERLQQSTPPPKTPDTPEEQFKLELEDHRPPTPAEQLSTEEQMQRLWAQLRRNKDLTGSNASKSAVSFSCFSNSDVDLGEVREAQMVRVDLLKRQEEYRGGRCPYCQKAIIDYTATYCTFCRANLTACKVIEQPQTVSATTKTHPRPERAYQSDKPYMTTLTHNTSKVSRASPPKPLKERHILGQSLDGSRKGSKPKGGLKEPSHGVPSDYFAKQPIQGSRKDVAPGGINASPGLSTSSVYTDGSDSTRNVNQQAEALSPTYYSGQNNNSDRIGIETGSAAVYNWRDMLPAHVAAETYGDPLAMVNNPQPVSRTTARTDQQRRNEQKTKTSFKTSYSSSPASSSSSKSSTSRRPAQPLAHRAVLGGLQPSTSSSAQLQLQRRPPPPPPERTFYADNSKEKVHKQRVQQSQQPSPHGRRDVNKKVTSPNVNKPHPASPSPLRHEIKGEIPTRKPTPGPLLSAAVYRPLPPTPTPTPSQPPARPLNRPLPNPKSPPQRPIHHHGHIIPSSLSVSSSSRPNQSRPLDPRQLEPVPHGLNHPAPLHRDSFMPSRPSLQTPRQSMIPTPATPLAARPRQAASVLPQANPQPAAQQQQQQQQEQQQRKPPPTPLSKADADAITKAAQITPTSTLLASALEQARKNQTPAPPPPIPTPSTTTTTSPAPTTTTTSLFTSPLTTHPLNRSKNRIPQNSSASSANIPLFKYDSWMTPEHKAEYERLIVENGDNADLYMDIFAEYTDDEDGSGEITRAEKERRRRTKMEREGGGGGGGRGGGRESWEDFLIN